MHRMISTVSTWRCKCGVRVKVVGEAEQDKPSATVTATCPHCGDSQLIYTDRIISITTEQNETAFS
jgi:hypothetical protein